MGELQNQQVFVFVFYCLVNTINLTPFATFHPPPPRRSAGHCEYGSHTDILPDTFTAPSCSTDQIWSRLPIPDPLSSAQLSSALPLRPGCACAILLLRRERTEGARVSVCSRPSELLLLVSSQPIGDRNLHCCVLDSRHFDCGHSVGRSVSQSVRGGAGEPQQREGRRSEESSSAPMFLAARFSHQ